MTMYSGVTISDLRLTPRNILPCRHTLDHVKGPGCVHFFLQPSYLASKATEASWNPSCPCIMNNENWMTVTHTLQNGRNVASNQCENSPTRVPSLKKVQGQRQPAHKKGQTNHQLLNYSHEKPEQRRSKATLQENKTSESKKNTFKAQSEGYRPGRLTFPKNTLLCSNVCFQLCCSNVNPNRLWEMTDSLCHHSLGCVPRL